jgi:hypothetical protein
MKLSSKLKVVPALDVLAGLVTSLQRKIGAAVDGTESGTWRKILTGISQQMAAVMDSVTESHSLSYI